MSKESKEIFCNKTLAKTFPEKDVILYSRMIIDKNNQAVMECEFRFGDKGSFRNRLIFDPLGNDLKAASKLFEAYRNYMLEQIDAFEECIRWLDKNEGRRQPLFSHLVINDRPFYIHGSVERNGINIRLFGVGIHDFVINISLRGKFLHQEFQQAKDQLWELRDHLAKHLHDFDAVNLMELRGTV